MHTALKRQVIELAHVTPEQEICGLFCLADGGARLFPCPNTAANPTSDFVIDPQDQIRCRQLGMLLGVYHSHPSDSSFSPRDLEAAEHYALPLYLYNMPAQTWSEFVPSSYVRPLEGQHFSWGFDDCYGAVRRYYRQNLNLHLGDYDRDESFQHSHSHLIMEHFEHEGFRMMPGIGEVRQHDTLIFESRALPHHLGVFVGNSRFFHQPLNALSHIDPLDGNWQRRLKYVLRHQSRL